MRNTWILLGLLSFASTSFAQHEAAGEESHIPHGPHHLSILVARTHLSSEGDNATFGIDYEYRISPLLGVGAVIEHAFDELDATTALGVVDIHIYKGFAIQVGPGVEHRKGEYVFVARTGVLYEIEYKNFTLSPQLHWDYHHEEANAIVAGISIGLSF
ncbi:MAG: hypothetical protein V7459_11340 [Oceanicoccus sp.]